MSCTVIRLPSPRPLTPLPNLPPSRREAPGSQRHTDGVHAHWHSFAILVSASAGRATSPYAQSAAHGAHTRSCRRHAPRATCARHNLLAFRPRWSFGAARLFSRHSALIIQSLVVTDSYDSLHFMLTLFQSIFRFTRLCIILPFSFTFYSFSLLSHRLTQHLPVERCRSARDCSRRPLYCRLKPLQHQLYRWILPSDCSLRSISMRAQLVRSVGKCTFVHTILFAVSNPAPVATESLIVPGSLIRSLCVAAAPDDPKVR